MEDLEQWQRNNIRLMNAGYRLHTEYLEDGSIQHYATKGDERIETPKPLENNDKIRP